MTMQSIERDSKECLRHARSLAFLLLVGLVGIGVGCDGAGPGPEPGGQAHGEHGGWLFESEGLALELALIEAGSPPVFRAWVHRGGEAAPLEEVELRVRLRRLGGRVDEVGFAAAGGHLEGDAIVAEPHSFAVEVELSHEGETHRFDFEQIEGRTRIEPPMAESLGLATSVAGPAAIRDAVEVFGRVRPHPDGVRHIRAPFEGTIEHVRADLGARVEAGDVLLRVESNESLEVYAVRAPISGVVTRRDASAGEQTAGRVLVELVDTSSVMVELSLFPRARARVAAGHRVAILREGAALPIEGVIGSVDVLARPDQSVIARVELDNAKGVLVPGSFVTAEIVSDESQVALAVKRSALQRFREHDVVYEQIGDDYEVRFVEIGRRDAEWVEVLGGLEPGAIYVAENSHLVKADIEKSGAAHDH